MIGATSVASIHQRMNLVNINTRILIHIRIQIQTLLRILWIKTHLQITHPITGYTNAGMEIYCIWIVVY